MNRNLNILITPDGIKVDTHRTIEYSSHYLNIMVLYSVSSDVRVKNLQATYKNKETEIFFQLDTSEEDTKIPSENLKDHYQKLISTLSNLRSTCKEYPGTDDYSKFVNYHISMVSLILSLFGLMNQDKDSMIMKPLYIIFPDIKIDINILNSKLYNFFRYYIDTLKNMGSYEGVEVVDSKVIKLILESIDTYFDYMKEYFTQSEDVYENMLCIHASNLGYGKYLEYRIQSALELQSKHSKEIENLVIKKQNEFKKYYDEELLSMADQTATIKNINLEIIHDTTEFINRSKNEALISFKNMKDLYESEIKKNVSSFIEEKNKDLEHRYNKLNRKNEQELSTSIINLENTQVSKIKGVLEDLLNRKTGLLKELQDQKSEAMNTIEKVRLSSKDELLNIKTSAIEEINSIASVTDYKKIKDEINKLLFDVMDKVKIIDNFKQDGFNAYFADVWPKIEIELKKQSVIIIQNVFEKTLSTLGIAIDKQISEKIEAKFKTLKK